MDQSPSPHDSVADLYAASYIRIVGVVALVAGSRADAEECVQEAFVRLLGRWDRVSRLESPEVWVRTVAFRLVSNRRRKARNMVQAAWRHGRVADVPPPSADSIDVPAALKTLPLGQRQVIVMHHLLGLSVNEIALALEIAPGTVKSRLGRARGVLTTLLEEEVPHVEHS
ncbi:sigma-70 family RNA polymerase sigma factor [Dactylosporangium sp. CA-233914]|uniref:sigma-70 family RNA polymerase sigma factor n=1 Tax=Dactylosporangium sp. CA-233914 TaxID=3239934 RepID=UPI003D8F0FD0